MFQNKYTRCIHMWNHGGIKHSWKPKTTYVDLHNHHPVHICTDHKQHLHSQKQVIVAKSQEPCSSNGTSWYFQQRHLGVQMPPPPTIKLSRKKESSKAASKHEILQRNYFCFCTYKNVTKCVFGLALYVFLLFAYLLKVGKSKLISRKKVRLKKLCIRK